MMGAFLSKAVAGLLKECKSNQRGSARFRCDRAGPRPRKPPQRLKSTWQLTSHAARGCGHAGLKVRMGP